MTSTELWFNGNKTVELRKTALPKLEAEQLLIKARASAVSAGTELLAYRGQLPKDMPLDLAISNLTDTVEYPLQYGYAFVGEVLAIGKDVEQKWLGKRVFSFQPHGTHAVVTALDLIEIPDGVSWEQAVLLPNMETAVSLLHDGAPIYDEQILVQGGGVVGYLLTQLLQTFPLESLAVVEKLASRRKLFEDQLGVKTISLQDIDVKTIPELGPVDVFFEVSGNPEALNTAIKWTRFNGRIVIGSWYGSKTAAIHLGESFHRSRIQIVSSQVSTINPALSGRWSKMRRMKSAWKALEKMNPEKIITHRFGIEDANKAYEQLDKQFENIFQVLFEYQ
ncbi:MAG: zinc-dependent alcohol dehydrogenase [Calditrichia bacterium]